LTQIDTKQQILKKHLQKSILQKTIANLIKKLHFVK